MLWIGDITKEKVSNWAQTIDNDFFFNVINFCVYL